jgi:hypothetical protein
MIWVEFDDGLPVVGDSIEYRMIGDEKNTPRMMKDLKLVVAGKSANERGPFNFVNLKSSQGIASLMSSEYEWRKV